jgi:hypothetical protein
MSNLSSELTKMTVKDDVITFSSYANFKSYIQNEHQQRSSLLKEGN